VTETPDDTSVEDVDASDVASPGSRLAALRKASAAQQEFPFAIVEGRALTELPQDLYIPPDALEVFLEAFEGPLDLLLYLIRRQNLDILDIRVAEITRQYMQYVELMKALQFELAAEYLVMAAMLAEIKSRMLLPRPAALEEEEGEDPRAELIRRLQEYERFKRAAEDLDTLPRMDRDSFPANAAAPPMDRQRPHPDVDLKEILLAFADVLQRAEMYRSHNVSFEPLSTRERMGDVLKRVSETRDFVDFHSLFRPEEGRLGVVVTFLAVMELIKEALIEIVQNEPFAPIHVRARTHA
jgi:segregation and condensation protein A